MTPQVYWIDGHYPGRLAVVSRPRGGALLSTDLAALRLGGVDILTSMLAPEEAEVLGLAEEGMMAAAAGLGFMHMPITDFGIPGDFSAASAMIGQAAASVRSGRALAAHCYAGRGRSPLFVIATLIHLGEPAERAITLATTARGRPVPETSGQREWLLAFEAARR